MSTFVGLQEALANRDLANSVLLSELETIVAPLQRLDERTRASIMVLVGLAELVTANQRSFAVGDEGLGAEFVRSLKVVHGEGARLLTALKKERPAESASPLESPLDPLMDVLRCLGLPAPVPYERRQKVRRLADLPPCPCDPAPQRTVARGL
jgi:hypothetical protein